MRNMSPSKTKSFWKAERAQRIRFKNQRLRPLIREGFWKGVFPIPVGPGVIG